MTQGIVTFEPATRGELILSPGHWRKIRLDGRFTAKIGCPECGVTGNLAEHVIASDGTVRPSVECPNASCSFHATIRLDAWGG